MVSLEGPASVETAGTDGVPVGTDPVLEARGLRVRLGRTEVLDGVDLAVSRGEWVCVVGPNGAGKTTLLAALVGLVRVRGDVDIAGRALRGMKPRERGRHVALVPQHPEVPPGIPVIDYVALGRTPHLGPLGGESVHDMARVGEILELLDLVHLGTRSVDTLSGGERQRVLLARGLAQDTPVLLLDEPTTALDLGHQFEVLALLDRLRADHDLALVTTMHDLTAAGAWADRVVLLEAGRVLLDGPPAEVLDPEVMAVVYGVAVEVLRDGAGRAVIVPKAGPRPRRTGRTAPPP